MKRTHSAAGKKVQYVRSLFGGLEKDGKEDNYNSGGTFRWANLGDDGQNLGWSIEVTYHLMGISYAEIGFKKP